MRIIAGSLKGRKLVAPKGCDTRPLTDRVKESLFDVICGRVGGLGELADLSVIDLFAGSGSFGLEAMSRGAGFCLFVERDRRAIDSLVRNIEDCGLSNRCLVRRMDFYSIKSLRGDYSAKFDVAFVDPPFLSSRQACPDSRLGKALGELGNLMTSGGMVVLRQERGSHVEDRYGGLEKSDYRIYGRNVLSIYEVRNDESYRRS
jgi:16S rRNA (guanine(966)-N(2))-methyltransferase RsmD